MTQLQKTLIEADDQAMAYQKLNLSQALLKEVGYFFEDYPDHPYEQFYQDRYLRQELALYVANRIFDVENSRRGSRSQTITPKFLGRSLEQKLQLDIWLKAGILFVLQENPVWVAQLKSLK